MDENYTLATLSPFIETDSTVIMFSHTETLPPHKRKPDRFRIQVILNLAFRQYSSEETESFDHTWKAADYAFKFSCRKFAEDSERKQLNLLHSIIMGDLDLPFDLERQHISWAFDSSSEGETVESVLTRLLRVARHVCLPENAGNIKMVIFIEIVVTNVTLSDYEMLRDLNRIVNGQNLLTDWFAKNLRDLVDLSNGSSHCARQALFKLAREGMLIGLKSVEVAKENEEEGEPNCCAICLKDFVVHDEIGIGLPCSHLFHGFCILVWIDKRASCPLCRFELKRFD